MSEISPAKLTARKSADWRSRARSARSAIFSPVRPTAGPRRKLACLQRSRTTSASSATTMKVSPSVKQGKEVAVKKRTHGLRHAREIELFAKLNCAVLADGDLA